MEISQDSDKIQRCHIRFASVDKDRVISLLTELNPNGPKLWPFYMDDKTYLLSFDISDKDLMIFKLQVNLIRIRRPDQTDCVKF